MKQKFSDDISNSDVLKKPSFLRNMVSSAEFSQKINVLKLWFNEFNDEQKNLALGCLLHHCNQPQMHMLSMLMDGKLHKGCVFNCCDPFHILPETISSNILSLCDPETLCASAQVNKKWNNLANSDELWRRVCRRYEWCGDDNISNGDAINGSTENENSSIINTPLYEYYSPDSPKSSNGNIIDDNGVQIFDNAVTNEFFNVDIHNKTGHQSESDITAIEDLHIDDVHSDIVTETSNRNNEYRESLTSSYTNVSIGKYQNNKWKKHYLERYRLRRNWLLGRCNVRTFTGHTQGISCVQFDDTRIVSGSSDGTIKVWDKRTNSPWSVQTLLGHSGKIRCLHLDKNRLISGSTDLSIKVWDISSRDNWASIACKVTMVGHFDTVRCLEADDKMVISGSYDTTLKMWDLQTGICENTLRGHEAAVLCVHFDQNKILSGSADKQIKVWSYSGECVATLAGHNDAVSCLRLVGGRVVSGSLDCTLRFWSLDSGLCTKVIDWQASEGHTRVVRCLQVDKNKVVSASDDKTIKVWSLDTGERLVTLKKHTDGVTCVQFNDKVLVSGSYDKTVKLWDFSCC